MWRQRLRLLPPQHVSKGPAKISLAHHGILMLDELPEFSAAAIDALREPLEDGVVTVARAAGTVRFPASVVQLKSKP